MKPFTQNKFYKFTTYYFIVMVVTVICAMSYILASRYSVANKQRRFIQQWTKVFQSNSNFESLQELSKTTNSQCIFTKHFKDGSWLAGVVESSDSGDFDATVICNQEGFVYWTNFGFSGIEGFAEYCRTSPSDSFGVFFEKGKVKWEKVHQED